MAPELGFHLNRMPLAVKRKVLPPGLEPEIAESESAVISNLTTGAEWLA